MSGEQQKMPPMEVKARDLNSPEAKADAAKQAKQEAEAKAKGMTVEQLEARQKMIAARRKAMKEAANFGIISLLKDANAPKEAPKRQPAKAVPARVAEVPKKKEKPNT